MVCPSTTQPSVHLSSQLIVAEKEQEASPLVPCSSPPWSHHAHGPSSSPCMGHREGNKTGFTREIPEHKQQLTTYPDKVSLTLSSSSSSSSSWQANKQKPTMTSHCHEQASARSEARLLRTHLAPSQDSHSPGTVQRLPTGSQGKTGVLGCQNPLGLGTQGQTGHRLSHIPSRSKAPNASCEHGPC